MTRPTPKCSSVVHSARTVRMAPAQPVVVDVAGSDEAAAATAGAGGARRPVTFDRDFGTWKRETKHHKNQQFRRLRSS